MALLTMIAVILGVWLAAGIATAALYAVLRSLHVRRQRALTPTRRPKSRPVKDRSDVLPRR
ncbi:hypothetical protein ACWGDE_16785 [Streptomyces sp. NPDC054956]